MEIALYDLHTAAFLFIESVLKASAGADRKLELIEMACETERIQSDVILGARDYSSDDPRFIKWCIGCEEEQTFAYDVCPDCKSILSVSISRPYLKPKFEVYETRFRKRREK